MKGVSVESRGSMINAALAFIIPGVLLLLVSVLGRNFKLFGAEMPGVQGMARRWLAAGCGIVLIVIGLALEGNAGNTARTSESPQHAADSIQSAKELSPDGDPAPQVSPSPAAAAGAYRKPLRLTGTVRWFSDAKGYGFIERDGGPDVFVHYSAIRGNAFKTLAEGDVVEFELADGRNGPEARDVTPPRAPR